MTATATPRRRLARATVWNLGGTAISLGSSMLASIAVAWLLGAVDFGAFSIIRATFLTATFLVGMSLVAAMTRTVADLRVTDPARAGRVIGLFTNVVLLTGAAATAACVAFAVPLARQVGSSGLASELALCSPYVVFASVSAIQIGALNGLDAFAPAGAVLAFEGLATALATVIAAHFYGLTGAVFGIVIAAALTCIAGRAALAQRCRERGIVIRHRGVAGEMPFVRDLLLPSVLFAASAQPAAWYARTMLARGPFGLAEVGVFSAAFAWGTAVLSVPAHVSRQAMPILTSLLAAGQHRDFRRLLRDNLLLTFAIAAAVAMPLVVFAGPIMRTYGPRFANGAAVLQLLALSSVIGAMAAALRITLTAAGHFWGQVAPSALWGLTLLAAFFVLRDRGAFGLAVAYVIAFTVSLIIQGTMSFRTHGRV